MAIYLGRGVGGALVHGAILCVGCVCMLVLPQKNTPPVTQRCPVGGHHPVFHACMHWSRAISVPPHWTAAAEVQGCPSPCGSLSLWLPSLSSKSRPERQCVCLHKCVHSHRDFSLHTSSDLRETGRKGPQGRLPAQPDGHLDQPRAGHVMQSSHLERKEGAGSLEEIACSPAPTPPLRLPPSSPTKKTLGANLSS